MQTFGSSLSCWHSPGYKSCCAANNIADLHVCEIREHIVSPCVHTCVHILFLRAAFHRSTNSISVGPSSIDSLGFNHLKHISACHCYKIVRILFFSKKNRGFPTQNMYRKTLPHENNVFIHSMESCRNRNPRPSYTKNRQRVFVVVWYECIFPLKWCEKGRAPKYGVWNIDNFGWSFLETIQWLYFEKNTIRLFCVKWIEQGMILEKKIQNKICFPLPWDVSLLLVK